jgi:cell division septal protein FtsQ
MNSPHIPSFQLYNPVYTNVYRWDLEQKNQLDGPADIALYMKSMEQLEKMKTD